MLQDAATYRSEYAARIGTSEMQTAPTVIDFREHGSARARPDAGHSRVRRQPRLSYMTRVIREKLFIDRVGAEPVLLVRGRRRPIRAGVSRSHSGLTQERLRNSIATTGRHADGCRDGQRVELPRLCGYRESQGIVSGAGRRYQGLLVRLAELQPDDYGLRQAVNWYFDSSEQDGGAYGAVPRH